MNKKTLKPELTEATAKVNVEPLVIKIFGGKGKLKAFFAGYLTCIAFESLRQDIMGKEKFLQWANEHWISAWITVPEAILLLIIAMLIYRSKKLWLID